MEGVYGLELEVPVGVLYHEKGHKRGSLTSAIDSFSPNGYSLLEQTSLVGVYVPLTIGEPTLGIHHTPAGYKAIEFNGAIPDGFRQDGRTLLHGFRDYETGGGD